MVATYQVDVVLPTKFAIESFVDDLLGVLAEAIGDDSVDFTAAEGQWTLSRPGEPPMPRWRTLEDHDVTDGGLLMLSLVESSEVFTPVVEDITDALALINEREFAEFDSTTAAVAGLSVLGVGGFVAAVLLSWSWMRSGSGVWCGLPALALGVTCWLAAVVARRGLPPRVALGLALPSVVLLFAGTAMLVPRPYDQPGPFAAANIAAGAIVAAAAAAAMIRTLRTGVATLVGLTAVGIPVAVAAGITAFTDLPERHVYGGLVLAGLILLTMAPRLAVVLAQIRPPDLPDPGSDVSPGTLTDVFDTETAQAAAADAEDPGAGPALGIEHRARRAVAALRGLLAGSCVLLGGSTVLAAAAEPGGVREIVLGVAVSGLLVLRLRWFPDRVQAVSLLVAAAVTAAGEAAVLVGAYASPQARLAVVLVLAAAATAGCVAATRLPGVRLSPVTRRAIDLLEYALIVVVPMIACWIAGIYTAMRAI
ncbi:type VII secretion integral membrane protein EccD [Nocardia stercoris]|uniref:Type VII secretion integral membrane protein EccD n=2 Tax=Nocardia stercoris TaxID=2483361 RepID=A0A3M2KWX9_9NOCA|nr:type VII secretion integral membrane protein EccD [Nocardia stercoris]